MARALVVNAPGQLKLENRLAPKEESGEVLVRVVFAGVCGTDLAISSGDYRVPLPLIPGHEFSGIVAAVGGGVSADWIGRRVTCEINNTCISTGSRNPCPACVAGLASHCRQRTVVGIIRADGAFQDYVTIPEGNLHILPKEVSLLDGTLTEPLAAALQTFEMARPDPGATCLVLGLGRLGALTVLAAAERGLRTIAVSRSGSKLTLAKKLGAVETICESGKSLARIVKELTSGLGADIVVEATGDPRGIHTALQLVRPRGTIAVKTTSGVPLNDFDLTGAVVDEIKIVGSRCGPFPQAIKMLADGRVPVKELKREIHPLTDFQQAFAGARKGGRVVFGITDDQSEPLQ